MKKIIKFFQNIGLEIAPHKSQLIIFSKTNKSNLNQFMMVNGIKIEAVKAVK